MKHLNDTNNLNNKIKNTKIDPADSLSSLTANEEGQSKYNVGKLHAWTGSEWNTWVTRKWAYQYIELGTLNGDTDDLPVTLSDLADDSNVATVYGYASDRQSLGLISYIGSDTPIDYSYIQGNIVSVTAKDGCWFHVRHNNSTPPSNHKPVHTMTGNDVHYLKKAVFAYNNSLQKWILFDQERFGWHRVDNIATQAKVTSNLQIRELPIFSFYGYYRVSGYLEIAEFGGDQTSKVTTAFPQIMRIGNSSSLKTVDTSGNFEDSSTGTGAKWFNNSLQGSAIIEVANLRVRYQVELPNGDWKQILSGQFFTEFIKEL